MLSEPVANIIFGEQDEPDVTEPACRTRLGALQMLVTGVLLCARGWQGFQIIKEEEEEEKEKDWPRRPSGKFEKSPT